MRSFPLNSVRTIDYCETLEKDHGRIEARRCWVTEEIGWLEQKEDWKNLKSVVMVEAIREVIGKEKESRTKRQHSSWII